MPKITRTVVSHSAAQSAISAILAFAILTTTLPAQPAPIDGETLYRSLFFASGPLADKIPTIKKARPFLPSDYIALQDRIINDIRHQDPKFFRTFAAEIQSGDHLRVAAELLRANIVQRRELLAIAKTMNTPFAQNVRKLTPEELNKPARSPEVEGNVAVFVVAFVLIFALITVVAPVQKPEELKGLSFERYVNEIVEAVPAVRTPAMNHARE